MSSTLKRSQIAMRLPTFFQSLRRPFTTPCRVQGHSFSRPRLEPLEDRCLLSTANIWSAPDPSDNWGVPTNWSLSLCSAAWPSSRRGRESRQPSLCAQSHYVSARAFASFEIPTQRLQENSRSLHDFGSFGIGCKRQRVPGPLSSRLRDQAGRDRVPNEFKRTLPRRANDR